MAYPVKRPLLWAVASFACGIICANYWLPAWPLVLVGGALVAAGAWCLFKKELRWLAFVAAFAAGMVLFNITALPEKTIAPYLGQEVVLLSLIHIFSKYADRLEAADDFISELNALLRDVVHEHKRVIFNGNNYSDE